MKISMPDWGKEYFDAYRYKGLKGGRGGGKSHFFAELLVIKHISEPDFQSVCVREIQKSIKFSVKKLIEDKIIKLGASELFDITLTEIKRIGSGGIIVFQGMQDHTAESIKSLEGFNLCFVEEAQSLSERSLELLLPTIREPMSEIWFSWNPKSPDDPVEKLFSNHAGNVLLKHVNFHDNKFVTDEIITEAARHKEFSPDTYDHVWLGVGNQGIESAFIRPEWIRSSIDAHEKILELGQNFGTSIIGFDVADEGQDNNCMSFRRGSVILYSDEWHDGDTGQSTRKVYNQAKKEMCGVVYDSIGVGAGAKAESNRLNKDSDNREIKFTPFNAGAAVPYPGSEAQAGTNILNKDFFCNAKAYYWWQLRQRFYNTYLAMTKNSEFNLDELISLSSANTLNEKLITELSRCKIDYDNNGRIKVESKKDMLKRGVKSPNIADSVVMCFVQENQEIYIA